MKQNLLFLIFSAMILFPGWSHAQDRGPDRLFQVYVDDDYLNIRGKGTDDAYTGGTKFAFFYTKDHPSPGHPSRFFADRALPKAGDSSIDVYGWSVMQIMFTPDNICDADFQPDDYPWSGALFLSHSLYSYNPSKKYDFQTEIILGIMGPAALAGPTQRAVHRVIHYLRPMGWGNQYGNSPLLNLNFSFEKQEAGWGRVAEIIGGAQVAAGTELDQLTVYQVIRFGKMSSYFDGFLSQFSSPRRREGHRKKIQAYFFIKPELEFIGYDAILQGGIFSPKPHGVGKADDEGKTISENYHPINHTMAEIDYGAVLALGRFSIAYTQKPTTAYMKGLYSHDVGNISVYFSWYK